MFRHILFSTDLTSVSQGALEIATSLAKTLGARLSVLHVCETPAFAAAGSTLTGADLVGPCSEGARAGLGQLLWRLKAQGIEAEGIVRRGLPPEHIVRVASEIGADLIITGTHGRHGIAHAYYGSVAEKVVQLSTVPVLAVPHHPSTQEETKSPTPVAS